MKNISLILFAIFIIGCGTSNNDNNVLDSKIDKK